MATRRIPPPMPGQQVPAEYVREQLDILGIKNVSEEDIESYAADLTKLIKDTLVTKDSNTDPYNSLHLTPTLAVTRDHQSSSSPSHSAYSSPDSTHQLVGHGSAVFKTFPDDKENRVHFLSPSPSPSPLRAGLTASSLHERNVSPFSSTLSSGGVNNTRRKGKVAVKRKVLRKCNGESRVFDESISEPESEVERPLARYFSDLSLTSVTSTEASTQVLGSSRPCCKSFIRPSTGHPHTRRLKKHDPVNRYHEIQRLWADFKAPGEDARHDLRWRIREQLLQDVPYYEPRRRMCRPNDFVPPTDKKRSSLRWEVRHALAHQ